MIRCVVTMRLPTFYGLTPPRIRTLTQSGVYAIVLLLMLALCACASAPERESAANTVDSTHADQLYRQGELEQAAAAYRDLAGQTSGANAAHFRLRAAEAERDNGNLDGAARTLGDLKRRQLRGDDRVRLDLLDAEIALGHGDAKQAQALLDFDDSTLPPPLRTRALELRARAALVLGDAFSSAHARAVLDRFLAGNDRQQNRKLLGEALVRIDADTLKARIVDLPSGDPLRPWIEQALRGQGQVLARDMPQPSQPVGTIRPGENGALEAEGYQPLKRVALLLPEGAQLAGIVQSIRDGFMTAYFADRVERRPILRIYDAGKTPADAITAYNRAVADGADHVVGPLQREAVGMLFHQALSAHVLALNHPDTGEVPPPGSAEFGLLPDAEGAQVAAHMRQLGIQRTAIIASGNDWAERAARAFRAQFEAGGGSVTGESRVSDKDVNYAVAITQATANLGAEADSGVFITMLPQQARLLLPQLRAAAINNAVFATSHVYAGDSNPTADRDLDGVEFCDAPWMFGAVAGRPDRSAVASRVNSASGVGGRLFAFGMDAYALLPYIDWLVAHPDSYLAGATGELTADSYGRIHRVMSWAKFSDGVAEPVDGALSQLAPVQ